MIKKTIDVGISEFSIQDPKHPIKLFLSSENFEPKSIDQKKKEAKKFLKIKIFYDELNKNIRSMKFEFK